MAKVFESKASRDARIVKDFATGKYTKAALARAYNVDEKTVRRAIKDATPFPMPSFPIPVGVKPVKSAKQTVKSMAKKATKAAGVKTSVKAPVVSVPASKDTIVVGARVKMSKTGRERWTSSSHKEGFNPHEGIGTVDDVSYDSGYPIHVKWDNKQTNCYGVADLEVLTQTVTATASAVIQALEAGNGVEFVITGDSIMLTLGDDVEIVDSTHTNYKAIMLAVIEGKYREAYDLMNIAKAITAFTKGAITVKNGELAYGEMKLKSSLVTRILDLMSQGDEAFKSLVNFLERLLNNPSSDSVEQLWGFVSHLDVEIDPEGYIIGWKKVRSSQGHLFDSYTGKVPNDVGNVVEMPRFMVNADRHQTCSQGLHVGAWGYVKGFSGDTILRVKVDPADVVSVPSDYKDMKMRAAKYEVIGVVDGNQKPIKIERASDVKKLHVKIGTNGEILQSTEI